MGQLGNEPDHGMEMADDQVRQNLQGITEELEYLKNRLIQQLSQEIEQLQERKTRLLAETEMLDRQIHEQRTQNRELAKQLAPVIADELLAYLQLHLPQLGHSWQAEEVDSLALNQCNDNAQRLINSLDNTLRTTFRTLQQDVSSYQSTLSQQLGQMYSLEQQGEAILDALVTRIRTELRLEGKGNGYPPMPTPPTPTVQPPQTLQMPSVQSPPTETKGERQGAATTTLPPIERPTTQESPAQPSEATPPKVLPRPPKQKVSVSQLQLGFFLVLFSSLILSLQNVVISIILNMSSVFGMFEMGGFISPSFGNSLLILFLRMLVVVPFMAILSQVLYPSSWQEIRRFLRSRDWVAFGYVVGCGFFLFASSALIYMALGVLSPGVALTLFFIFPIVTVVCAWIFFGDRPSIVRWGATFTVFLGIVLIALPRGEVTLSSLGIATAIGAGVTFAFHVLLIQSCTKRLHPVPFSVLNFGVILIFSFLSLFIPLPGQMAIAIEPGQWWNLLASGCALGGLTLVAYLTQNIGVSYIGAARASILGATGPALTSLLALLIIARPLTAIQFLGMLVVTAGVLGQNLERFFKSQTKR